MDPSKAKLNELASNCVKCGLCLPHCPTYELTQLESESPRGRISLLQGVAAEVIAPDDEAMNVHLSHCLGCRNCERVCPAEVPYGDLLVAGRAYLEDTAHKPHHWLLKLLAFVIRRRNRLDWLNRCMRLGRWLRVHRWLNWVPGVSTISHLPQALPHSAIPLPDGWYEPTGSSEPTKTLGLMTGCVQSIVERKAIWDAITLFTAAGYRVYCPKQQACCGTLALYEGQCADAQQQADQLADLFDQAAVQQVTLLTSGCYSGLSQIWTANAQLMHWTDLVDMEKYTLRPLKRDDPIYLQTPCTWRNTRKNAIDFSELLAKIPGFTAVPLTNSQLCCGAAGSQFMINPESSLAVLKHYLPDLEALEDGVLVTPNIGCALWLQKYASNAGIHWEITHPISMLVESMDDTKKA